MGAGEHRKRRRISHTAGDEATQIDEEKRDAKLAEREGIHRHVPDLSPYPSDSAKDDLTDFTLSVVNWLQPQRPSCSPSQPTILGLFGFAREQIMKNAWFLSYGDTHPEEKAEWAKHPFVES